MFHTIICKINIDLTILRSRSKVPVRSNHNNYKQTASDNQCVYVFTVWYEVPFSHYIPRRTHIHIPLWDQSEMITGGLGLINFEKWQSFFYSSPLDPKIFWLPPIMSFFSLGYSIHPPTHPQGKIYIWSPFLKPPPIISDWL